MVELILSPALYPYRELKKHNTVVIDVLRATTSICAAFKAGASHIVPLNTLEQLPQYKEMGYTLAAERDGKKLPGATCGNSPTEYLTMNLSGQKLAYSTTNGTVGLILAAKDSIETIVGCFANKDSLAHYLNQKQEDLVILCSGWKNGVSIEDTLFAGALLQQIKTHYNEYNDAAAAAMTLYESVVANKEEALALYNYCQIGSHIQRLQRLNYDHDIRFAFESNTCPLVPVMQDGLLITK